MTQYAIFSMLTLSTPYCTTSGGKLCIDRSTGYASRTSTRAAHMREVGSHDSLAAPNIEAGSSAAHWSVDAIGSQATLGTVAVLDESPKVSMNSCGGSNA